MQSPYPWQQTQWQQLQTSWQNNRMPHALLLAGPAGLGKHDFAFALAKSLLSTTVNEAKLFNANTHPDFFLIRPEAESKVIKVDQIRELITSLNQTAQYSGYQVAIIEPADALNIAAANALLKTLEEPQGKVVLILISSQYSLLPATIRSRCQQIMFQIPPVAQTKAWLMTQLPAEAEIDLLLQYAEGVPLIALDLAQNEGIKQREQLSQQLQQIKLGKINPVVVAAEYAKKDVSVCIDTMISLVQTMIRSNLGSSTALFTFYDLLCSRKKLLLYHNSINTQLLLEEIFISWLDNFSSTN